MEKILRLVPHELERCARRGHAVVRQLHHKRDGVAAKERFPEHERRQNTDKDAENVQSAHGERLILREKRRDEHGIDGDLGAAAHKRREKHGHAAVALARERSRRHDRRNGAAKADEHRHNALSGKADTPQELVHHKRDARHIPGVLQHGKEEEQHHDDRQKLHHVSDAAEQPVNNERVYDRVDAVGRERRVRQPRQRVNSHGKQIGQKRADHLKCEIKHQQHDADKDRQGENAVREDVIDGARALPLAALLGFFHRFGADRLDERIAHIGNGGVAVEPRFALHLHDAVLAQLQLVFVERKPRDNVAVSLDHVHGRPACAHPGALGVILHHMRHGMDAAVDRPRRAEVVYLRLASGGGRAAGKLRQIGNTLALRRADRHDRDAKQLRELYCIDRPAVGAHLVHHIQRKHHRHLHFDHLQREIEVALNIRGVHDVDNAVGLPVQNKIARDDLLGGVRPQRIDARQIDDFVAFRIADGAAFAVHRDAGKIADVLVAAGELIEERCFSAVLVSGKSKSHAGSTSTMAASSSRSDSVYPRRNTSTGSPIGAMRVTVTDVLGMTPISRSRSRSGPSPPTLRMIPDCPTCSLSSVISFFSRIIWYLLFYGIIAKNQYPICRFCPALHFCRKRILIFISSSANIVHKIQRYSLHM